MISVAIMAHPKRILFVEELVNSIDYPVEVVWDTKWDRWDTGSRAVLAYDPDASHHIVLQDDAIVCRDFIPSVEMALKHIPSDSPLMLYVGRVRPHREKLDRALRNIRSPVVLRMNRIFWGVGVVFPTKDLEVAVAFGGSVKDDNYDIRMARWYEAEQIPAYAVYPSLVDHRREATNPSLIPRRHGDRYAHWFEPNGRVEYLGERVISFQG